jgi:(2Fe-2S) ferredoxin
MKAKIINSKRLNIPGNGDFLSNREILTAFLKQWRRKLGYCSLFTALPAILTSFAQEAQAGEAKKPEVSVTEQTASLLEKLNSNCGKPKLFQPRSNYRLPLQKSKYNIISELAGGDDCPGTPIPGGTYTAAAPYTDSGNTTGANDTVSNHSCYFSYYDFDSSAGPDQIYTFTLTGRGANPQVKVSTTSSNCDGDGKTDFAVYRDGIWYMMQSSQGFAAVQFGLASDKPTVGDYDGDGKADQAVYRNGIWYVLRSTQGFYAVQFGIPSDIPVAADYDGDGKTNVAVYRNGIWYLLGSQQGISGLQFGALDDKPVPAVFVP